MDKLRVRLAGSLLGGEVDVKVASGGSSCPGLDGDLFAVNLNDGPILNHSLRQLQVNARQAVGLKGLGLDDLGGLVDHVALIGLGTGDSAQLHVHAQILVDLLRRGGVKLVGGGAGSVGDRRVVSGTGAHAGQGQLDVVAVHIDFVHVAANFDSGVARRARVRRAGGNVNAVAALHHRLLQRGGNSGG